ncbi:MAG: germination protein YpeB [Solirubrobacterales bacterium]
MKTERKRMIYTGLVTLIVVFSSTFAILMTLERTDYRNYLQSEYSKNMYGLIDNVENIRVNLGKSAVTGSREQSIVVFEEIFRNSAMAGDKLHSLPVSEELTAETSKFLSQVGDFCYTLAKSSSEGKELKDEDYKTIETLKQQSFTLESSLKTVSEDINSGNVKWGEIRKKASGVFAMGTEADISDKFKGIQKQVVQYPSLIYDGPFSDNVLEISPRINSEKQVSESDAEKAARTAIGNERIESIELQPESGSSRIESYRFIASIKGRTDKNEKITCEISKRGGRVVYLIDSKAPMEPTIDVNKAVDIGARYLSGIGYKNMKSTYTLNYENTAVISFVYIKDNVTIYPDQIKLKVSLGDGSITGIESEKYLIAHYDNRIIPKPQISSNDAKKRVGKKLNITSVKLAIVPSEGNKEVLCYEFTGNYNGDNFIVYINAETGYEQKIIQIINTPNGELTI